MPAGNIKTYILDASFILAFLLPDEREEKIVSLFKDHEAGKIRFISSIVLPLEVVNGLRFAVNKRISRQQAITLINDYQGIYIEFPILNLAEVLEISLKNNLSVYDASYLYLSKAHKAPLLILDD